MLAIDMFYFLHNSEELVLKFEKRVERVLATTRSNSRIKSPKGIINNN